MSDGTCQLTAELIADSVLPQSPVISPDGRRHLAYLAVTPPGPIGGLAIFDVTVPAGTEAVEEHRNLTEGVADSGELGLQEAGLGGSCGWESAGPHRHDQLSPISYASKIRTPVLILHGQDDTNVPVGQAMYFHRALCRFGVGHELVIYPREGHPILERGHQIDLLRRTRAWFDRWL